MAKLLKRTIICLSLAVFAWCGMLLNDREALSSNIIRLHVVANSDSGHDQSVKLQVRDAIISGLKEDLNGIADVTAAKAYLQENLPKIEAIANDTLQAVGFEGRAVVTLCKESFDTRYYDTFTLPAGVYEALRIMIGAGEGKNWWCVVFPSLCIPATSQGFQEVAAGAGFSDTINGALIGQEGYALHFFFLDALGELENIFFAG